MSPTIERNHCGRGGESWQHTTNPAVGHHPATEFGKTGTNPSDVTAVTKRPGHPLAQRRSHGVARVASYGDDGDVEVGVLAVMRDDAETLRGIDDAGVPVRALSPSAALGVGQRSELVRQTPARRVAICTRWTGRRNGSKSPAAVVSIRRLGTPSGGFPKQDVRESPHEQCAPLANWARRRSLSPTYSASADAPRTRPRIDEPEWRNDSTKILLCRVA
jgi:hypothetical protein